MTILSEKAIREIEAQIQSETKEQDGTQEGTGGTSRRVCSSCGHEVARGSAFACNQSGCPKCGTAVVGRRP